MDKRLIIWDIDDVLNSLMRVWHAEYLKNYRYNDIKDNPPLELCSKEKIDYLHTLDDVRRRLLYKTDPNSDIINFFRDYGHLFGHLVLSSTPLEFMSASSSWVFRYFSPWIQNVCFIPSVRTNDKMFSCLFQNKAEAVLFYKGILVDDSSKNVSEVIECGGKALLFPAPWNKAKGCSISEVLKQLLYGEL